MGFRVSEGAVEEVVSSGLGQQIKIKEADWKTGQKKIRNPN